MGDREGLDILNRGLPKWPLMLTTGEPVTREQAEEIIRRTDRFIQKGFGGNDHDYDHRLADLLQFPRFSAFKREYSHGKRLAETWSEYFERCDAWDEKWGTIQTDYVNNSWISSAFIYGPHGWCHPNGDIGYLDNVGKWPSGEEVYDDWMRIAEAFSFLKIGVSLWSGEDCEDDKEPVIGFMIEAGSVAVVDPKKVNVHEGHPTPTRLTLDQAVNNLSMPARVREHAIPWIVFERWAADHVS